MAGSVVVGMLRALLTLDSAEFEAGARKASDAAKAFSKSFDQIGRQAEQVGAALTKTLTVPIMAAFGSSAKAAMDFESSFAGVRKTVDASEPEFDAMAQSFRDLAKSIPINVNEINRLGEAAGALGVPKAEIVDFSRVMALLGVTTNVTSDQAAESIAKIQTVFQAAGKETENFASTLVDLGNNGASTEAEILELANRIASAGRAVGMSQADVLGFSSAIANVGINAEAGGTAISKVFADISIAVSKGGDDLSAFAKYAGLSSAEFSRAFKDDAAGAVRLFIEGLGKAKNAGGDLNLILEDLGFKEVRQARALRDLALSGDNLAKSLGFASTAWRENTALSAEAQKRFETTEAKITLLWNRVKDLGITIGNALLPMIQQAIGFMDRLIPIAESVARAFAGMDPKIQAITVAFGLAVAAAGPALWTFGQLAGAAADVAGAFGKKGIATRALAGAFDILAPAARAGWAALLGPVGLIIAAGVATKLLADYIRDTMTDAERKQVDNYVKSMGGANEQIAAALRQGMPDYNKQATDIQLAADASIVYGDGLKGVGEAVEVVTPKLSAMDAQFVKLREEAEKLTEAWLKSVEAFRSELFGDDRIAKGQKYVEVLGSVDRVSQLTAEKQEELQKAMLEAMEAMSLSGRTTEKLQAQFLALYLKTVQLGVGAKTAFDMVAEGARRAQAAVSAFTENFSLTGVTAEYAAMAKAAAAAAAATGLLIVPQASSGGGGGSSLVTGAGFAQRMGLPGYATGTDGFMDFGSGTPVMLHGREMVVPEKAAGQMGGSLSVSVNVGTLYSNDDAAVRDIAKRVGNELLRTSGRRFSFQS